MSRTGFTIKDFTPEFLAFAENEVEQAVAATTIMVQEEAMKLVSQHQVQRAGTTPGGDPRWVPPWSRPGDPPWQRSGYLHGHIDQETFRRKGEFIGRVGSNVEYARALEFGFSGNNLKARPYLRPALDTHAASLAAQVKAAGKRMGRFRGGR